MPTLPAHRAVHDRPSRIRMGMATGHGIRSAPNHGLAKRSVVPMAHFATALATTNTTRAKRRRSEPGSPRAQNGNGHPYQIGAARGQHNAHYEAQQRCRLHGVARGSANLPHHLHTRRPLSDAHSMGLIIASQTRYV